MKIGGFLGAYPQAPRPNGPIFIGVFTTLPDTTEHENHSGDWAATLLEIRDYVNLTIDFNLQSLISNLYFHRKHHHD